MKNYIVIIIVAIFFGIGFFVGNITNSFDKSLNIISFNIRYDNPDDGDNIWLNRKEIVAGMIKFHKPDIAGLQEVLKNQLSDLEYLLPEYEHFGVGRGDGIDAGEFSPILYLKDRFKFLDGGTIWLSETPDIPSKGWDAALNRIVSWVKLIDKSSNLIIFHFNTHFDHMGVQARTESSRLLLTKIYEIAGENPVSVTGDFNYQIDSDGYKLLTRTGAKEDNIVLMDAGNDRNVTHHGPTGTWSGFKQAGTPGEKIDFIFTKNNYKVLRHGILSDTFDGRFPSDHLPVLAEIIQN